jgi:hypothetical protein
MNSSHLKYIIYIFQSPLIVFYVFILKGLTNKFKDEPNSKVILKDYKAIYIFKNTAINGPAPV